MDTLHDRLVELAGDAPKGGASAAELWARGKRAHRLRVAVVAATVLVVGAVGAGIGVRVADRDHRSDPAPAGPVRITLPITYPAGDVLPDVGHTPGPLAAIWVAPGQGGSGPAVVGLVAKTGRFGTLSIDVAGLKPPNLDDVDVALSADGRRLAYLSPKGDLVVHDLVNGKDEFPAISTRPGFTWVDATRLVGHDGARGGDGDGWVWEPGTKPKLVDYWAFAAGFDLWPPEGVLGPLDCSTVPKVGDATGKIGTYTQQWGYEFAVPVLCDVLDVIGADTVLGHDRSGAVVALDIRGAEPPFDDLSLRHEVVDAGAPDRVTLATDVIGRALRAEAGAS